MLTSEKTDLLQSFLGSLPGHLAARLAKAVEVDRLTDGTSLPHDVILSGLRPSLRRSDNPHRTPTPLRLLCRPFEDLLVDGPRKEKQKGRILRASVMPLWTWLAQTVLPAESKSYHDEVKAAVLAYKFDIAQARAEAFWPVAGEALRAAVAKDHKDARLRFNGDGGLADVEEMALMLLAGSRMVEVQAIMPKPVPVLDLDLLWRLRRVYDAVVESVPDAAPYVPVVTMARLAKPWEALRLALLITHQTVDTLISSTDMGLVGDLLFADLEHYRGAINAAHHPNFDEGALLANLAAFTEISSAVVKEIDIRRDGKWGKRLLKDRAAVGAVMDGFMERAPKEIAAALPTQKSGFSGSGRLPDFTRPVDPDRHARALRYARLMGGSRLLAAAASFGAKLKDAMDEAGAVLRRYVEDLVKEMRTAEGPRREVVERQFQLCTELTAIVFSEEEAEFLRRRGKAALSAAA
jgi:hypothetical protein